MISGKLGQSFRLKSRRMSINLKEEMKQLLFTLSGPVCISENERVFKDIMLIFYQYEQSVSSVVLTLTTMQ